MRRNCSLDEISDGTLYTSNELAKLSCNSCKGAASCCHGMGNTIILDPYDIYRLSANLKAGFEELLKDKIELNLVDGIILPNLKMAGPSEGCTFLGQEGKCSIHASRPGICRLFPLGRYYDNHNFKYFLQVGECHNTSATKIKISKWLETPALNTYERFLVDWHYFLNDVEGIIKNTQDEKLIKNLNLCILNGFYIRKYNENMDFYQQFYERLKSIADIIKV